MLHLTDIKALNIEPSSQCVAKCPFCSRNKKVRDFQGHYITLSDFKKLPSALLTQLEWIDFGGNFGDLSTNRALPAICAYAKEINPEIILRGDTNGSAQDEIWWGKLGQYFNNGVMIFSIDGLEDTHTIHRINTDFNKILTNIKAFSDAGGRAEWKFILFKHNEHQIDEAEKLAREIGCSRFIVISSREYDELRAKPDIMQFRTKDQIYSDYQKQTISEKGRAICKPLKNKSIYLAADKTVHPCCLAHCNYISEQEPTFDFIISLIQKYHSTINFTTTPLEEILQGEYFTEVLKISKTNEYCLMKCNKHRKKAKQEVVLIDKNLL